MTTTSFNLTRFKDKIIAIDGPAGSGKSTTARLVAARLGYKYLDTGAMYRAITLFALENRVAPDDEARLTSLARKIAIEFETGEKVNRVSVNGRDVTEAIRSQEVTRFVSQVSAHKGVREAMVARQREMAKKGSVVAEGRDTTTVVFPDAHLKIYLNASIRDRAQRRMIDLSRIGVTTTLEEQMADIERRDEFDSNRQHSPLTRAKGAQLIDTSDCTIEDQVERVLALFRASMK